MNFIKTIYFFLICLISSTCIGQTADEIINTYFEKSGGIENWRKLKNIKMTAEVENEGMVIPLRIYTTKDGKQAVIMDYMDQEITQIAFDGKDLWATNAEMLPEKADKESTENVKLSANDFPSPFLDYEKKDYFVDFLGIEKVNGKEVYKIMLIQEPIFVNGKKDETVSYYYFDTETYLPVMKEVKVKGEPITGKFMTSTMGDYKKVDGLYFPFLLNESGTEFKVTKIVVDSKIKSSVFEFPEEH